MPTLARLLTALLRRTPPVAEPSSDADLLTRFANTRDADAFELLVWRHGATVFGVCRRMLRHEQSAEDAFQATFLILAKRAGSVRGQLAGWLHTTARRVCLRLAKRKAFAPLEQEPPSAVPADGPDPALAAVLDAEIARLPEKFRLAVILCYLHGLTTEQAAERLGVPRGTVLSRLANARKRLVERLTAKGVTVPAAFLTTAATTTELAAEACTRTAAAAVGFVTSAAPSTFPTQLATEVLSMTTRKAMIGAGLAAAVLMAGVGTGLGWATADGEKKAPQPAKPAAKAEPQLAARAPELEDPNLKRQAELLRELDRRILIEEDRTAALRKVVEEKTAAGVSPARARLAEEMVIDLTKKVFDTELALAGAKVELMDAEEASKKLRSKAEERQKLADEVLMLTEKVGKATVREKDVADAFGRLGKGGGIDAAKYEQERRALANSTKERLELETLLRGRQSALDAITAEAAEADAKRLAVERAKSNLHLQTTKLAVLREKLDQVTAQAEKAVSAQAQQADAQAAIDQHRANIRKLHDLKFELELRGTVGSEVVGKSDERIDRILKLVEDLRREVKELRDGKK